jgi:glycerophosphoryl diester phosphodiesterase
MANRIPDWLLTRPIAHRGRHTLPHAPENSLAAFAAAIEAGYPIELDLRLLADGNVAVFHDADTARLTGVARPFGELTTSDLTDLRLLQTEERIPTLRETLDFVAGAVPLLIEIKSDAATFEALTRATRAHLQTYDGPFAIQSFHAPTVLYLAEHAPDVVRGQLASGDGWRRGFEDAPTPDFFAYNIDFLPTPLTTAHRANGIPLLAWTVRTPEQQAKAGQVADNFIFDVLYP